MNFYISSIVVGIVLVLFAAVQTEDLIPSCTGMMMRVAKKQIKSFGECSREMKAMVKNDEEFGNKMQCVLKCVLNKAGMLNAEGRVTKDTMQSFMDKHVPELYHSLSHDLLEHCIEEFGPKMEKSDDEFCSVYGDYVACIQDVVANVC